MKRFTWILALSAAVLCGFVLAFASTILQTFLTTTVSGQTPVSAGGIITSVSSYSYTSGASQYLPPSGNDASGTSIVTTEAAAQSTVPSATTASNLAVSLSAAPGAGDSITVTFRDNGSSTSITCTVTGASAKTCSDTTHTASPSAGDLVDYLITYTGTPASVYVSASLGFGGGSAITFAPPYLYNGTNYYVAATGYQATRPPSSPSWINGVAPSVSAASGPNGDYVAVTTDANWQTQTCTSSVEAEFAPLSASASNTQDFSIWIYDSTNSKIWEFLTTNNSGSGLPGIPQIQLNQWSYSGSGNPSYTTTADKWNEPPLEAIAHFKISVSGGTATFAASTNGGGSFITFTTQSVGTISQCGFGVVGASSNPVSMDVYSLKTT